MKLFLNEPIFFHLIHSCFKLYFGFRDGTRRKWDFFFVFIPCRLIALENCWIAASGKRGSSLWSRNTPDMENFKFAMTILSLFTTTSLYLSILILISLSSGIEKFLNLMCTFLVNDPSLDSLLPSTRYPNKDHPRMTLAPRETFPSTHLRTLSSLTAVRMDHAKINPPSSAFILSIDSRGAVARRFAGPRSSTVVAPPRVG